MAEEYGEYTKEELKRLEELERLGLEGFARELEELEKAGAAKEEVLELEKKLELELEEQRELELQKERELEEQENVVTTVTPATTTSSTPTSSEIVVSTQQDLTDLGIYLPIETTSQEEIKRVVETIEIAPATPVVNFNLKYNIEKIPTPDMNKIYSLTTVESNVWDKPTWEQGEDNIEFIETHVLKNFVGQNGNDFNISVGGAKGTEFRLAIFNETDDTYYSWQKLDSVITDAKTNEESIVSSTGFYTGQHYFSGIIPDAGKQIIPVSIPTSGSEVVYRVGFLEEGKVVGARTDYGGILPIFNAEKDTNYTPLYKLTQLPQSSTVITLTESELSSNPNGALTISHPPGSLLNNSISTLGKYDISLSISPRNKISLSNNAPNGILDNTHILLDQDSELQTEILSMNLIASIKDNVGTVSGTITLGKSSLRKSIIKLDTPTIFTTNPDIN